MIKEELKALYLGRRLSMAEIAKELGTTHATVLYWLKKHGVKRRSWSESTYLKLNPEGNPFDIPDELSPRQRELLIVGLLLFWTEGNKGQLAVRLANLDPRMLQLFLMFLREVCHVRENRVHLYVRVHRQFALAPARRYWTRQLRVAASRVHVYRHTDARSKAEKQWSPYGLATLQVHSSKLKAWLDREIETYLCTLLGPLPTRVSELLERKQLLLNGKRLHGPHR